MSLSEQIKDDRKRILRLWFQQVLETFPKASRLLIASESNRFANPIGFTFNEGIEELFAALIGEKTFDEIKPALDRLVKLKAIQENPDASQLGFMLSLKQIIRERYGAYSGKFTEVKELLEIEDRIDQILLKAYEIYVQSREKILELQVNEIKNKSYMFLRISGDA